MEKSHNLPITTTSNPPPSFASKPIGPARLLPHLYTLATRLDAGHFRISLALSGQAFLWKTLNSPSLNPLPLSSLVSALSPTTYLLFWSLSATSLFILLLLYALRLLLLFPSVRAEFSHHVAVNYLFTPFTSSLILLHSNPFFNLSSNAYTLLFWCFSIPILALDVKIYGQWFTKGKRFLSAVANPTSQMTVIANMASATVAARMGWGEVAAMMFAVGLAHYFVLFVTLYQRLAGAAVLPGKLRPAFFLFIATPGMAFHAWRSIAGEFDIGCRMLFYLAFFLFASLVSRPALFRPAMQRINVAWWSYSFPMSVMALMTTEYAQHIRGFIPNALMLVLLLLSVILTLVLMIFSALNPTALLCRRTDPAFSFVLPHLSATAAATMRPTM